MGFREPFLPMMIRSDRQNLVMRQLELADHKALYQLVSGNRGALVNPFPVTIEHMEADGWAKPWLRAKLQHRADGRAFNAGIFAGPEMIGMFSAFNPDWRVPRCEVSWMLDSGWTGEGVAGMALELLLSYLFDACGFQKVICRIATDNLRSQRLAERAGFIREGLMKRDFRDGSGNLVDVVYHAIWADSR